MPALDLVRHLTEVQAAHYGTFFLELPFDYPAAVQREAPTATLSLVQT